MSMDANKINEMLGRLFDEKMESAEACMRQSPMCQKIYERMCKAGYEAQMRTFKNIVFLTYMMNPNAREEDILREFMANMKA